MNQRVDDAALENFDSTSVNPSPVSQNGFDDLGMAPALLKAVNQLKFENPTPIQKGAIPAGLKGDDIIAIAQTGSGKTLAFGIPMLQRLSQTTHGTGLVLVPTRELAVQVEQSLQAISRSVNIRSVVLIGGASMNLQRSALRKNPRIIIATPGRMMDHIEKKTVDLSNVDVFILDEADRMLDMGFVPDIKKIMKSIPDSRQTMLFSATMPKPIEAIAEKLMVNPIRIEIDRSGATPSEVSHEMFMVNNADKSRLLAHHLKKCRGPVLVFTKTKWMARKLTTKVNKMGFATAEIHSKRTQGQRMAALEGFKRGKFQILIATDIAARGIDVTGIELVVNYDMPANSEDYVHRIGRTGRAGKTGHAVTFAMHDQKGTIREIERFMKTELAISDLPNMPSESILLRDAARLKRQSQPSRDEKPSSKRPARNRPSKRREVSNDGPRKFAAKRPEFKRNGPKSEDSYRPKFKRADSRQEDSNRPESKPRYPRRVDSSRPDSKSRDTRPNDSNRPESAKKDSKSKKSKPAKVRTRNSKPESAFWANFKKHRPAKSKSNGSGSRRKRRAKRK